LGNIRFTFRFNLGNIRFTLVPYRKEHPLNKRVEGIRD